MRSFAETVDFLVECTQGTTLSLESFSTSSVCYNERHLGSCHQVLWRAKVSRNLMAGS